MVPAPIIGALFFGIEIGGALTAGVYVATIVVNLAVSALLGKILAPSGTSTAQQSKGLQNVVRDNVTPRRIIYGEAIVGGPYAVLETLGFNNETLSMVVIVATHPVDDIIGVLIDDEYIDISGPDNTSNDLDGDYWVDQGIYGTNDAVKHVKIIKNNGWGYADIKYVANSASTDPILDRARGNVIESELETTWTQPSTTTRDPTTGLYTDSGHKLTNCAHIYLSFKFNPDVFRNWPKLRFHVKGKRLYNPAREMDSEFLAYGSSSPYTHDITNPDTYEWSDNWALCCLDYLLNDFYGLGARTTGLLTEIDWTEAIQAYNDSSEQITNGLETPNTGFVDRYTVNGVIETNATPISTMEGLLASGSGELIYAQGKYKLRAGVYKAPNSLNDVINEDYMVSGLSIQTHTPRRDVFNKAAGVFVDIGYDPNLAPSTANKPLFEASDFELVNPLDSGGVNPYEAEDDEEIIREFDYPFTIHEYEAKRLARIQLERVRKGLTISFEGNLKMLKYSVGDNIYLEIFNNPKYSNEAFFNRLGLDDTVQDTPDSPITPYYKQFKIVNMEYNENFNINVVLVEEDEQIYDWNDGDANVIDHALISEIVFDDPTGEIIKPNFYSGSIEDLISWPNISTLIKWDAPDRGSLINALDRAHIRSYNLEYGEVTNPSAADRANRVTNWIKGTGFLVTDFSAVLQGPISLENLFVDNVTTFDFRLQAVLFNGRKSNWAYYSEDVGSDFLPTSPPSAAVSAPVSGAKTFYYDTQVTSINTSVGFNSGEFALVDGSDFTPASYSDVDTVYLCVRDIKNIDNEFFINNMRNGDTITFYISNTRWYKYKIDYINPNHSDIVTDIPTVDYANSVVRIRGLELIDYKDDNPTDVGVLSQEIEFRCEKDPSTTDFDIIFDTNFDIFPGFNSFYTGDERWLAINPVYSPDVRELVLNGGEIGSNAIQFLNNPVSPSGQTIGMRTYILYKNFSTDILISVRYQSISGTITLDDTTYTRFTVASFPHHQIEGQIDSVSKTIDIPPTASGEWKTVKALFKRPQGRFCSFSFSVVVGASETQAVDILVDSFRIQPVIGDFVVDVDLVSNVGKINSDNASSFRLDLLPATGNVTVDILSDLNTDERSEFTLNTLQDSTNRTITWQNNGTASNVYIVDSAQPSTGTGAEDLWRFVTIDGGTWWIGKKEAADYKA